MHVKKYNSIILKFETNQYQVMFESHRPFIRAVLDKTSEFTQHEIEEFLHGIHTEPKLSMMFGSWTRGNPTQMQMFADLPDEATDFIKKYVDDNAAKDNSSKDGGRGQDTYINEAMDVLKRQAQKNFNASLGDAASIKEAAKTASKSQ